MSRAMMLGLMVLAVGCGDVVSGGSVGAACTGSGECHSGDCVDGFCCATSCAAICMACSAAKTGADNGTCAPVILDQDPDDECVDDGAASCDRSGGCNGNADTPACSLYPANTACGSDSCTAGSATSSTCNGDGACVAAETSCAPFIACDVGGARCQSTCTSDGACIAGNHCDPVNKVCTTVLRVAIVLSASSRCRDANESLTAFANLLTARGHVVTMPTPAEVDTLAELQTFDVVIPTGTNCANTGNAEAIAIYGAYDGNITAYVNGGGGIVAAGWVLFGTYLDAAPQLSAALPTSRTNGFTGGSPAMTPIAGHPITTGVAGFTAGDYSVEAGGTKSGATTLMTNPSGTAAGAAWSMALGRVVYLAPVYFEPWSAYANENLLDGSQPSAIELVLRAVEWAGRNR